MSSLSFSTSLLEMLASDDAKRVKLKSSPFIKCDRNFILDTYHNEDFAPGIFYTPLLTHIDFQTKQLETIQTPGLYDRTQFGSKEWASQSTKVFDTFYQTGRATKNGRMIHPVSIDITPDKVSFNVQECGYFDQVATHLGIDYKEKPEDLSLRDMLNMDYPGKLPALKDGRLSNSFGVSLLLFYQEHGQWIPTIFRRTQKLAIAAGSLSSTASGAVDWPKSDHVDIPKTLENHIIAELEEETGILRTEIQNLTPVFLGREAARAGKMQALYAATTDMTRDAIAERFIRNTHPDGASEFMRTLDENKIEILPKSQTLFDYLEQEGIAPECMANIHYALPYLKKLTNNK